VNENQPLRAYLPKVVLLKNDCEKGAGIDLAKKYEVRMYPTFALVNAGGEVTDRWAGYEGADPFMKTVDTALADRRTIAQKKEAFAKAPNLPLSLSLASYSEAVGANGDAVTYYREAMKLDAQLAGELRPKAFMAMFYGLRSQQFTPNDVVAAGQEIIADPGATPGDNLMVAGVLKRVAPTETYVPVLQSALKATAGATDPDIVAGRQELEIDAALLIDKDADKALRLKRASMPDGWQEDPSALNDFAWWCCESDVNHAEAFDLAMKGANLASADGDKANILDTAAEIAFKRGDTKKAIELEEQAIQLMPDRKNFQQTLERFKAAPAK
jgi:tetratricopeptide (TPR) repeat protein